MRASEDGRRRAGPPRRFSRPDRKNFAFQGYCDVYIDGRENRIVLRSKIKNTSHAAMFGQLYVAFFDTAGRLIDGVASDYDSRGAMPGGTGNFNVVARPLPLGMGEKIASYKITLYESDGPIQ